MNLKTITIKRNGRTIEFEPIIFDCTYHYPEKGKKCINCDNTGKYVDGYYMIYTLNGKKFAFMVDNIK